MKKNKHIVICSIAALLFLSIGSQKASAASTPSLSLSAIGGGSVQVTVYGADPGATVMLYYSSATTSSASVGLGLTNSSGYLSTTISAGTYGIQGNSAVYVNVDGAQSASSYWPASTGSSGNLSLSQTVMNMGAGQSESITANNAIGALSISSNSNPGAAMGTIFGNTIVVAGTYNPGTTILTVCDSANNCQSVNVAVLSSSVSTFSLSSNTANLLVGQSQTITASGLGPFSISQNSNPSAVSATISGNNIVLTGISSGGATITVCQTGNQCGTINSYSNSSGNSSSVPNTTIPQAPVSIASIPLALASFSVASGNQNNNLLAGGNSLTVSFSANQSIMNVSMSINGTAVAVNGSGSGPYTAVYTMTGSERMPLPIIISFSNSSGAAARQYFWTSNSSSAPASTPAPPQNPVNTPSSNSSSYQFDNYLYSGMNKVGQSDPNVVALQNRLAKDGYFSGSATGYFGPVTKAAVKAYQTNHGLSPLGVVGPATRNLLNQGI